MEKKYKRNSKKISNDHLGLIRFEASQVAGSIKGADDEVYEALVEQVFEEYSQTAHYF